MNSNDKAWNRITKEVEQINKSLTVIWVIVRVTVLSILGKNIEEEIVLVNSSKVRVLDSELNLEVTGILKRQTSTSL